MIRSLLDLWHIHKGRNPVNETKMHGIVARHLLEKNLGNLTTVFVNDSFGIVTRTLWFCFPNSLVRISPGKMGQGNPTNEFGKTKPKSSGNDPKSLTKTSVKFPKFSSQRRRAMIHALRFHLGDCTQGLEKILQAV